MSDQVRLNNITVLANAIELSTRTILEIAGNEIANSVGGKQLTPIGLRQTVAAKLQANLSKKGVMA